MKVVTAHVEPINEEYDEECLEFLSDEEKSNTLAIEFFHGYRTMAETLKLAKQHSEQCLAFVKSMLTEQDNKAA